MPADTPAQHMAFMEDRCRREDKILEEQARRVSREKRLAAAKGGSEAAREVWRTPRRPGRAAVPPRAVPLHGAGLWACAHL